MSKLDNFTNEQFREIIASSCSMREIARKLGYKGGGYNGEAIKHKCYDLQISLEHITGLSKGNIKRTFENVFIKNSTASQSVLRRWYEKGQYSEYKCSICGQEPFWNGKDLSLTLDHINGNNTDHRLENLRWVCPNCDRQLDTFCSKNIKHKEILSNYCIDCGIEIFATSTRCNKCQGLQRSSGKKPPLDELKKILYENKGNFTQVGKLFGLSDNAIRKWCQGYNISSHSSDYK